MNLASRHWREGLKSFMKSLLPPLTHIYLSCVFWKDEATRKSVMGSLCRGVTPVCFHIMSGTSGLTHNLSLTVMAGEASCGKTGSSYSRTAG